MFARSKTMWTLPSLWTQRTRPQGTWKTAKTAGAASTDGSTNRDLTSAAGRSDQQEARDVRARDQPHESDRAGPDEQRRPHVSHQYLLHTLGSGRLRDFCRPAPSPVKLCWTAGATWKIVPDPLDPPKTVVP